MVETQLRARGIRDAHVLRAMERVPRHEFVDPRYRDQAYEDHPLPINAGQTVSQPFIVALMLEILHLEPGSKVLEIGTGSGYQTAVLAEICGHVYSVERHPQLAAEAQDTLSRLGFTNLTLRVGDGSLGLPEYAPFDAIVVSAAAERIPAPLFQQLARGWTPDHSRGLARGAGVATGTQAGREAADHFAGRMPLCPLDQQRRLGFTILSCPFFATCASPWK